MASIMRMELVRAVQDNIRFIDRGAGKQHHVHDVQRPLCAWDRKTGCGTSNEAGAETAQKTGRQYPHPSAVDETTLMVLRASRLPAGDLLGDKARRPAAEESS